MHKKGTKHSSGKTTLDMPRLLTHLANMQDDGTAHFRQAWKPYSTYPDAKIRRARDELRLLWSEHIPVELKEDDTLKNPVPVLSDYAQNLYEAWYWEQTGSRPTEEPLQQFVCKSWLKQAGASGLLVDWENRRVKPDVRRLPIVLVWGCLQFADGLAYCHNPECAAPFYIRKRNDQQYCSGECAAPAKREAKRRWWKANRTGGRDPGKL
jgi:hypothetical protein